ncbi:MAG TPA: tyrosine-type recombinase/integrase [Thermodesulfovibrionales bacterium]|nr:tyrosine-type recombinase/integrase [Thermodesulfovibrionales bacterium]
MKNEEPFSIKMTAEVKSTLPRVLRARKLISPYIFVDENGKPYSRKAVSMAFKRACKRANIRDQRFHDIRHDFATLLSTTVHLFTRCSMHSGIKTIGCLRGMHISCRKRGMWLTI